MRTGNAAITWARENRNRAPAGHGSTYAGQSRTWYRMCLQYVRLSYGIPGGTANAGLAWDRAQHKHRTDNSSSIPRGVPVFWELPSVADHVALSAGDGWCWSNDVQTPGKCNKVRIDDITRAWNGTLLGWTEDLNGVRVWTPPRRRKTKNITAALSAKTRAARVYALKKVVENGSRKAASAARVWLAALEARDDANEQIAEARAVLKEQERR